jgi:cytochrome P450 family 4
LIFARSFDVIRRIDFFFKFTQMYQQQLKYLKGLHDFTDSVIQGRRKQLLADQMKENFDEGFGIKRKKVFLDVLLQSEVDGQPLSDIDIREEVDTLMFGGHDTGTSAVSFCLYNLAKYPDIQQKVFEEAEACIGNDTEPMTLKTLNDLHYLELVIKESLRLYPSIPFYGRQLTEELTANGYTFPKNSNVYVSSYLLGRNETIFPDPLDFKPERFDVETTAEKLNPFAYVPFSAGKRTQGEEVD